MLSMATNKRKVMLPHTMGKQGIEVMQARGDIETIIYPAGISQAELLPRLGDIAGIALSGTPYRQEEMDASPVMQAVARIGVGYDAVEIPALTARRVPLLTAGTANSTSVAEQAFNLIIALAKKNRAMHAMVTGDNWTQRHIDPPMELSGKTILIVGFGRIGTRTARRCAAFDMTVLIHDPYIKQDTIRSAGYQIADDIDAALPKADIVCIHCPKSPETVGMFNATRFGLMKKGGFIVNTARGGIIDEPALYQALTSGHLAGAGLDVFEQEPTPADNPLLSLENVISSPHMAGVTTESIAAMAVATSRNILSVLDGTPNRENTINPEVYD
jgi:D-3-phosphoglycerate dehydrogenase / 2-oxoglutarate reductase